jgi:hypothetical protein
MGPQPAVTPVVGPGYAVIRPHFASRWRRCRIAQLHNCTIAETYRRLLFLLRLTPSGHPAVARPDSVTPRGSIVSLCSNAAAVQFRYTAGTPDAYVRTHASGHPDIKASRHSAHLDIRPGHPRALAVALGAPATAKVNSGQLPRLWKSTGRPSSYVS